MRNPDYQVQTTRLVTRLLHQTEDPELILERAPILEGICLRHGIAFLSLGTTSDGNGDRFLKPGILSQIAASLRNTSFTVSWKCDWGLLEAKALASEIFAMANGPREGANFRFAVSFNCPTGVPYFPAASAGETAGFSIGTENSGLLYESIAMSRAGGEGNVVPENSLRNARDAIHARFGAALGELEKEAELIEAQTGVTYMGIDASVAPALDPPSITSAFAAVGLGTFGQSGTLAVAETITAALKSLPLRRPCGYCGLMLPVCEDSGLAAAVVAGEISLQNLLEYSAVCGVGLDTVPVPGPDLHSTHAEKEELIVRAAALILDIAALSRRLMKPLTMRLLPVPGAAVGQATAYNHPYLVESAVMAL